MASTHPVFVNGTLVRQPEATISVFDHGLVTGDGVFESVLVHEGRTFALRRHLERLERSAEIIGLVPPPRPELERAVQTVVEAAGLTSAKVRITVTAGLGPLGSLRDVTAPSLIVAAVPLEAPGATSAFDDAERAQLQTAGTDLPAGDRRPSSRIAGRRLPSKTAGVPPQPAGTSPQPGPPLSQNAGTMVALFPWPRNERGILAGAKTISYVENVVALKWAAERGASEALFANLAGHLCEGTGTNVFVVHGGRLITPPLEAGCLAGVTRALVLELSGALEADLEVGKLGEVTEAFLTSTTRGVQAIGAIDGSRLPASPGPVTSAAMRAYEELLASTPEP